MAQSNVAMPEAMRPRFKLRLSLPPDEAAERVVAAARGKYPHTHLGDHVELDIPQDRSVFWSPRLQVQFEDDPQRRGGCIVYGLIGPRPAVWTMFAALFAVFVFSAFFGLMVGVSELLSGGAGWGFAVLPASALGIYIEYRIGLVGKHLAAEQTAELRRALDEAIGSAISAD